MWNSWYSQETDVLCLDIVWSLGYSQRAYFFIIVYSGRLGWNYRGRESPSSAQAGQRQGHGAQCQNRQDRGWSPEARSWARRPNERKGALAVKSKTLTRKSD